MDSEVFICHASADALIAKEICDRLESDGVRCWIAPRDPLPGIPWAEQIVNAIAATRVVLLVLSAHSNESRPVLGEIESAANRKKVILPVRIADVEPSSKLELYLHAIHWFDAATRPLKDALPELVRDVQALIVPEGPSLNGDASAAQATRTPRNPSNLPAELSSLIGRERDVAEIEKLLRANRLVTVVGVGGAGKTRTAIAVGDALLGDLTDGVWLVELAPISQGSLVATAIARALSVRETAERPVLDTLIGHCRHRRMLLILDNCEHVISDARRVAAAILRECPDVRILATSQQNLGIGGERVVRLPSLELPPPDKTLRAKTALRYGAVALFADRASAADGRFGLDEQNVAAVVEICRQLDGIPLAIELAAARINVLSPQQLAQRLDERFRILIDGDLTALPRHQTMRAAIDWSYDLLAEPERALFRKIAIFADGFTLEAASAVCGDEGCDDIAVLDMLSSLVRKSLLQSDPAKRRYRMLESTRQYAREKLADCEEFKPAAARHLKYFLELFQTAGNAFDENLTEAPVRALAADLPDARSALDWGEKNDIGSAVDLFVATRLWIYLGVYREAIERAQRMLTLLAPNDALRLAALYARIASLNLRIGYAANASDAAERAVERGRASGQPSLLADCLIVYADVMSHAGRFDEAQEALEEAARLATESPRRRMHVIQVQGMIASMRGDLEAMGRNFAEVHKFHASLGNDAGTVSAAINLAEFEHARGATSKAVEIAKSATARAQRLPNRDSWAFLMRNLAGYLNAADDLSGARNAARDALSYYISQDPDGAFAAVALEHLALAYALEGDLRRAATVEGYVEKTLEQRGFKREFTERITHERLEKLLRENLEPDLLVALLSRGEAMQASELLAAAGRRSNSNLAPR